CVGQRLFGRDDDALPDLIGVVLDPAGLREVLRQLAVPASANTELVVDDETRRAARALVDGEDQESRILRACCAHGFSLSRWEALGCAGPRALRFDLAIPRRSRGHELVQQLLRGDANRV